MIAYFMVVSSNWQMDLRQSRYLMKKYHLLFLLREDDCHQTLWSIKKQSYRIGIPWSKRIPNSIIGLTRKIARVSLLILNALSTFSARRKLKDTSVYTCRYEKASVKGWKLKGFSQITEYDFSCEWKTNKQLKEAEALKKVLFMDVVEAIYFLVSRSRKCFVNKTLHKLIQFD